MATYEKLEIEKIRKDFPILNTAFKETGRTPAYLDNAATTQKPLSVINAVEKYYKEENANPLRGLYKLSVAATDAYEEARVKTAEFINAEKAQEIIFTRNATESLNLLASSLGDLLLKEGDEIVVTIMEHHSNMLPWRAAAKRHNAKVTYLYCDEKGKITKEAFEAVMSDKVKIVSMAHVSNVLGVCNDIKTFASIAHKYGALFVADGAQSVPHMKVDVLDLDVDFLAFSGHKMLAPMGIGVLYGKYKYLEAMPPFLAGGEMIETVTLDDVTYAEVPHKFEAGTVNAGGAVGLSAAMDYINRFGFEQIEERENFLTSYAFEKMKGIPGITIYGSDDAKEHHGIITFKLDGVHPHDVAYIMDSADVNLRAGHHCAQPLLKYLKTLSTSRISLAFYNTTGDIDRFIEELVNLRGKMGL